MKILQMKIALMEDSDVTIDKMETTNIHCSKQSVTIIAKLDKTYENRRLPYGV